MSRMEINALTKIVESAEAGGYTLPAELTDTLRTYERVKVLTLPQLPHFNADAAAARVVSAVAAGEDPNLTGLIEEAASTDSTAQGAQRARAALEMAVEQAAGAATLLANDKVETVITEHLAPAHARMLEEVREVAVALEGYGLDAHALLTAPAKVRNAYLKLPELVVRNQTIREARRLVNALGHREAKHDTTYLFATFEDPMALRRGWKAPARIPRLDAPTEPDAFLLWLVSDEVAPGRPWLPTLEQQDAAWWRQFGEGQEMRAQAHRNGLAVGARIG